MDPVTLSQKCRWACLKAAWDRQHLGPNKKGPLCVCHLTLYLTLRMPGWEAEQLADTGSLRDSFIRVRILNS